MFRRLAHRLSHASLPLLLSNLIGCAVPNDEKINLDKAVAAANQAVSQTLGRKFEPQRIEIAEELEKHTTNYCLTEDWADSRISDHARAVRQKLLNRQYYVIRYPLPPPFLDSEGGWNDWLGQEYCAFVDSRTGEVLGVVVL